MSEKKNIDKLFQEQFKDFEVKPPEKVWEHIKMELNENQEEHKIIPFWWKLSGIAVAIVLGFLVLNPIFFNKFNLNQNVILKNKNEFLNTNTTVIIPKDTKNEKTLNETIEKNSVTNNRTVQEIVVSFHLKNKPAEKSFVKSKSNALVQQEVAVASDNLNTNSRLKSSKTPIRINKTKKGNSQFIADLDLKSTSNSSKKNHETKRNRINRSENVATIDTSFLNITKNKIYSDQSTNKIVLETLTQNKTINSVQGTIVDVKKDTTKNKNVVPNPLEELLNEKESKTVNKEPKMNRWQVVSTIAPIYLSSTSNGSPLDSKFENNTKEYKTTLSYGVGVQYFVNKKWAIRSGVNTVAINYNTNDIVFSQNSNASRVTHIATNLQGSLIQIENKNITKPEISLGGYNVQKFDGNLNQKIGYLEIPLEMSYKLIDKKVGVSIIGGLSTLLLKENTISLQSSGVDMNIGEANNLNKMHFSSNLGIGLNYVFFRSFQAHLEPTLKYQWNTFSNDSGNFKPYFFGVYSGLSYSF